MNEPRISINGFALSEAQSMTVRVAIQSFLMTLDADGLGNDEHGRRMTAAYIKACGEVNAFMQAEAWPSVDDAEPTRIQLNPDGTWNTLA